MNVKRIFALTGLAAVLIVVLVGGAFATEATNPASSTVSGFCRGFGNSTMSAISDLLGINAQDLRAERQNGRSLADIAEEKGIAKDVLVDKIYESRAAQLQERVKAGDITQEQADAALKTVKENIDQRVDSSGVGCGGGGCADAGDSICGQGNSNGCGGGGCGSIGQGQSL